MVKLKKILLCFLITLLVILLGTVCIFMYFDSPVDRNDNSSIEIVIPSGTSTKGIAKILKEKDLIRNELYFSFYIRMHKTKTLKASKYQMNKTMSLKEIIKVLEIGNSYDPDELVLTFKEGERITSYINVIVERTEYTEEEIVGILNDEKYLKDLISRYWFLDNSILNKDIYYPLEGYLAPDTYFFKNDVTPKEIIEKLLDQEEKNLAKYKSDLKNKNVQEVIIMASIVELEGTNAKNRKEIVGVFNNRLAKGMNLGSDVTTYYALQLPLTMDLSSMQFMTENPYNTRAISMAGKLPVGPICNPSLSSIDASINPSRNDYYYFVADKHGNIYYTKTLKEHEAKVAEIKEKGDWIW